MIVNNKSLILFPSGVTKKELDSFVKALTSDNNVIAYTGDIEIYNIVDGKFVKVR